MVTSNSDCLQIAGFTSQLHVLLLRDPWALNLDLSLFHCKMSLMV